MLRTLFSVIAIILLAAMAFLLYTTGAERTVDKDVISGKTLLDEPVRTQPAPVPAPLPIPIQFAPMPQPAPVTPVPPENKVVQAPMPPPKNVKRTHVVQPGDSLFSISRKYYGTPDHFRKIAAANALRAHDPIRVRQVLVLPDLPSAAGVSAGEAHASTVESANQDFEPQLPTLNVSVPKR